MTKRGPVIRAQGAGQRRTLVITRSATDNGITDTPDIPPGGGVPSGRVPSASSSRAFGGSGSQRTLTVHGANAAVPLYLGGPQRYGGYLIAYKKIGNYHYFDIAWGEGPLQSIGTEKFGNLTAAGLGIGMEHHLGVAGDTTSTLMAEAIPTYVIPEFIAHSVFKVAFSDQVGDFSPMDLTVSIEGWVGYDFINAITAYRTRDPFMAAWEMLTNPRQGNNDYSLMKLQDFVDCATISTADIGAGEIRWELSMRIDQQDTLQNHVVNVLSYAFGHMRFNDGLFGCWIDWRRDRTVDSDGPWIVFKDHGNVDENTTEMVTCVRKGRGQIPTVATGDYSDAAQQFVDASVQFPSSVSGDWREQRYSMPGITLRTRMLRWLQTAFRLLQEDREARIPANFYGAVALQGDRIGVDSRRLIGAAVVPDNSDAAAGIEEMIVVEQTISGSGVELRAEIYREEDFDDVVSDTGGPTPPGAEGNDDPEPPTDLVLENVVTYTEAGLPVVRVHITFTPADMGYPTDTLITYSRDAGVTFTDLEHVSGGEGWLDNPTLSVLHVFRLFTRRLSTGQLSATYVEEDIVPTYTDDSIPEVTQIRFGVLGEANLLRFYGPIEHTPSPEFGDDFPPAPTLTLAAGFGLGATPGDHFAASSRLFKGGEGKMGAPSNVVTVPALGGPWKLDITNMDPTPPANTIMKKAYLTNADDSLLRWISDEGVASTGINWSTPDPVVPVPGDNYLAPVEYNGVAGWEVFDAFGIATPATDPMPLFTFLPWPHSPHKYKTLDCTPIAHQFGDKFYIQVYIKVVLRDGRSSAGVYYENLNANGILPAPPQSVPATVYVVDGINENLDIPAGVSYVNLSDPGGGLLTADWVIGGITIAGAPPTKRDRIVFVNKTTFRGSLGGESAGSTAASRIAPPGGAFYDFGGLNGSFTGEYDLDVLTGRWVPIAINNAGIGPSSSGGGGGTFIRNTLTEQSESNISISGLCHARIFAGNVDGTGSVVEGGGPYNDLVLDTWADTVIFPACTINGLEPPDQGVGPDLVTPNLFGVRITIVNGSLTGVGSGVVLKQEQAGSVAGNRFNGPDDLDISTGAVYLQAVTIQYNYQISRWIKVGQNF